jgi:hypothetical protein
MLLIACSLQAQVVSHDRAGKKIHISDTDGNLQLDLLYSGGCRISQMTVKGRNTLSAEGAYTAIKTDSSLFTSLRSENNPGVKIHKNIVRISNIVFGNGNMKISETWIFNALTDKITWEIQREYLNSGKLEMTAIPAFNFSSTETWKGGILNTGGVVWCKYFKNLFDTYGVHTDGVTFWETGSGSGLRINSGSSTGEMATSFSHAPDGIFRFTQCLTPSEAGQRYDLSRFVSRREDVFAPFEVRSGTVTMKLELSQIDYNKEYSRGTLPGFDAIAIRELLNTTGRYGVVDKGIIGGNGWITNWKCLHEPFFAMIGMAVNDSNYLENFAFTLDRERDHAVESDGRVLARWHNVPEAEKSNYNFETGYYDCPWGYTVDAQPSQVINTAELFQQTGDVEWLRSHQQNCEKILNWLIKRDSNNNGIFEMLNNSIADKKCSDWIDVVWASYENAFVNALMYEALNQWAECETILGDKGKAAYYSRVASRLKDAFNKPVEAGGFWSEKKKQYIYWRDRDGSLHGDNLVTPVNFAAIAFGICDDKERVKSILDQIETRMSQENLFHWPLCFDSFRKEEVYETVNWPFPNYENGDIFLTWGYLAVRSYVKYDKDIAIKYIRKLLEQYNKDGLSSQRFSRTDQKGIGEDILAGACTSVAALYRDIYGIRPKWNRFGLEPNLTNLISGTEFSYVLRNKVYKVHLKESQYEISNDDFAVNDSQGFGIDMQGNVLRYFPGNKDTEGLMVTRSNGTPMLIDFVEWSGGSRSWKIRSVDTYKFTVSQLYPDKNYRLIVNGTDSGSLKTDERGIAGFEYNCTGSEAFSIRE